MENNPHPKLSPRETLIISLIVEGMSNKQIAAKLGISYKTTINHRANAYEKLKVHNTAELIRFAIKAKIVTI